jgi:hypothetical protein
MKRAFLSSGCDAFDMVVSCKGEAKGAREVRITPCLSTS